jgi:AcrR family transcriptional regulator
MGRTKGKRDERLIKSRKVKIMTATYLTVIELGLVNTRASDIAQKANVSQALMFYYFKSMENIFIETLHWVNNRIAQRLIKKVDSVSDPILQLKIRVDDSFLSTKENRRFYLYYLDFLREGVRSEIFRKPNLEFNKTVFEKSLSYIQNGIKQNFFRDNLDLMTAASMIKANIDGFMIQWLFDAEDTFHIYRKRCLDVIFRYILKDLNLIDKLNLLD